MAINHAELLKRLNTTPVDAQLDEAGVDAGGFSSLDALEAKYGDRPVADVDTSFAPSLAPQPREDGFITKVARAVTPIGESIGAALGVSGAKKMEKEVSGRQEELSNVAVNLIRRKDLSPAQKQRALKALQMSSGANVIEQSGAFNETASQTVGKGLLTLGSVTGGAASGAASKLGLTGFKAFAARTGAEALAGAGTFGLGGGLANEQRGGELAKSVVTAGLVSGMFNAASEGFGLAARWINEKLPAKMMNNLINARLKDFNFGKNPGQTVADEGIMGATRGSVLKNINKRRREIGRMIGDAVEDPSVRDKTVNVQEAILAPIREAKARALKSGEKRYFERLVDLEEGLTSVFKEQGGTIKPVGTKNLMQVKVKGAQQLKQELGESTRWTDQPFDDDINGIKARIYREIDTAIDKAVPGIKKLNERYAGLITAEKSLERAMSMASKNNLVRLGTGAAGFGVSSLSGADSTEGKIGAGIAGALAFGALRSPAAKTILAQGARRIGPVTRSSPAIERLRGLLLSGLQNGVQEDLQMAE